MPDMVSVIVRGVLTFAVLLTMTRIMGKRQLAQLSFFDYVVGITIGSMAATGTVELENAPMAAVVGMLVWTVLPITVAYGSLKSEVFRNLVYGKASSLIEDGKLMEEGLNRDILSTDDVMTMLRQNQAFSISDVEDAILETDGQLSVLKKGEKQAVTAGQLNMPGAGQEKPAVVIQDGSINTRTLRSLHMSQYDLKNMLLTQGVEDVSEVMLAQLDGGGSLYVDLYDDWRVEPHRPHTAKLLHANLLKFQAQMETFALDTENPRAQSLFNHLAAESGEVMNSLRGYLQ